MIIYFAGDMCPRGRVSQYVNERNISPFLDSLRPLVTNCDYFVANLECPLIDGSHTPIKKIGPALKGSVRFAEYIDRLGINCVTLANNHIFDYGEIGLRSTIASLENNNIKHVGAGHNIGEASNTLILQSGSKRLAIINCCESEFNIATTDRGGACPLSPINQYYQIQESIKIADFVIVVVHGGVEHYQYPTVEMKHTYQFFIDAGADAVINTHQHCFSGYEIYHEKPIIYGLGNFIFDTIQRRAPFPSTWYEGYFAKLDIDTTISFDIIPYIQCKDQVSLKLLEGQEKKVFFNRLDCINSIIQDDTSLSKKFDEYILTRKNVLCSIFEPFSGKYARVLRRHKLIPSLITNNRKYEAYDFISCDSHRLAIKRLLEMDL